MITNEPCEHFPSPMVGYDWERDVFYCCACDKEFRVEEEE